jgi:hypothetical protein
MADLEHGRFLVFHHLFRDHEMNFAGLGEVQTEQRNETLRQKAGLVEIECLERAGKGE